MGNIVLVETHRAPPRAPAPVKKKVMMRYDNWFHFQILILHVVRSFTVRVIKAFPLGSERKKEVW